MSTIISINLFDIPTPMMLFNVLLTLQDTQLQPGKVTQLSCNTTNQRITLSHQSTLNQISIVLESNEVPEIQAYVTGRKKTSEQIPLGIHTDLSQFPKQNLTLWYKCDVEVVILAYYYDAQVAYEGQLFMNDNNTTTAYFMFPVCHANKDIQIITNGTVTASFSEGYPQNDIPSKGNKTNRLIPYSNSTYSSYLFIKLEGANASLTVFQQNVTEILAVNGEKYEVNISSLQFCYRQFYIPDNLTAKQIVVSGQGSNNYNTYGRIYYKTKVNLSELPTDLKNEQTGLKSLELSTTPNGAFSVRTYQRKQFLPLDHNPNTFGNNQLIVYVLNESELMQVGVDKSVEFEIKDDVQKSFLVDWKSVSDFSYVNSTQEKNQKKYRYFIAQATSDQDISNLTLLFCPDGLDKCNSDSGAVSASSQNSVQVLYKGLENSTSTYNDLIGVQAKRTSTGSVPSGKAQFEAENMYLLQPRTQYRYKGKNPKYGVAKLVTDTQLMIQLSKPMAESVIVSISQKYFFPSKDLQDDTFQTQTCSQSDLISMKCHLNFQKLSLGDVYIKFESTAQFDVAVGNGADIATLMYLDNEISGKLNLFNAENSEISMQYVLDGSDFTTNNLLNQQLLFIAELDKPTVKVMLKNDLDFKIYFGYDPNPDKNSNSFQLSMRDWVSASAAQGDYQSVLARGHIQIPLKGSTDIYIAIRCMGNCLDGQEAFTANFNIYPTLLNQLSDYSQIQDQGFSFKSEEEPISGTFMTLDQQSALIKFYRPNLNITKPNNQITLNSNKMLQKISKSSNVKQFIDQIFDDKYNMATPDILLGQNTKNQKASIIDCESLKYIVTLCIGFYPKDDDMLNLPSSCQMRHIDISESSDFVSISLDSSQFNVSSGTVYFRIDPDASEFSDDIALVSYCQVPIDLYISDQLLDFDKQYKQVLFAGSENDVHLAIDFPAYAGSGANDTEMGDYFVVQLNSEKLMSMCITDDANRPYGSVCLYNETGNSQTKKYYFKNYRNFNPIGQLKPHTRVYLTLRDGCQNCSYMEPYTVNVSVMPQTSVRYDETQYFAFQSTEYYGSPEFMSFAVNLTGLDYKTDDATIVVTPDCFTQDCKENPPEELQYHNLITYLSFTQMLPNGESNETVILDGSGPQTFSLQNLSTQTGVTNPQKTLYVHVKYRYAEILQLSGQSSPITFSVRLQQHFGSENVLSYQETKRIKQLATSPQKVKFFSSTLYYEPSEIVIFPCKGRIGLSLSRFSLPDPTNKGSSEQIMAGEWGKPLIWRVYDVLDSDKTMYLGVYDANAYNQTSNSFENVSDIEYDIFVGSSSTLNIPGGNGQVEVVDFSESGDGKLKVRFAPASAPNQNSTISQVNYFLYVIPYQGAINESTDYSPYTSCGVKTIGYSVYTNSINLSNIEVNQEQLEKYGYIEVESNLPLWRDAQNVSKALSPIKKTFRAWKNAIGGLKAVEKQILYVTVLAGQVSYTGTLVESSPISQSALLAITLTITLIIVAVLVVIFWVFFVRVRKIKKQGYKPVIA